MLALLISSRTFSIAYLFDIIPKHSDNKFEFRIFQRRLRIDRRPSLKRSFRSDAIGASPALCFHQKIILIFQKQLQKLTRFR